MDRNPNEYDENNGNVVENAKEKPVLCESFFILKLFISFILIVFIDCIYYFD